MDITLATSAGKIEASYYQNQDKTAPIAIVFHDTPKNNGHKDEKVNYTIFYSFLLMGFSVLRFNFKGCKNSSGTFENGEQELIDASAVIDYMQTKHEEAREFWLAGVGFGAWVAMQSLMRRVEANGYIAVSPYPKKYDYSFFNPAPCDGVIIGAEKDTTINQEALKTLANNINKHKFGQVSYISVPGAEHNYPGKLKELSLTIRNYIQKSWKK